MLLSSTFYCFNFLFISQRKSSSMILPFLVLLLSSQLFFINSELNSSIANLTTNSDYNSSTSTILKDNSTIILDKSNSCSFETIVARYPKEQVCSFNIDLSGPIQRDSISKLLLTEDGGKFKYSHCHVIDGHLSLRHHLFTPFNKLNELMRFENLEYIRDFLLIYDFKSEFINVTLGELFPRLKRIYGYTRIENFSLYISHYETSENVNLTNLEEICGPVKFYDSKPYFRHSPTYWHVVQKYAAKKYFSKNLIQFNPENVQVEQWEKDQNWFEARLRFTNIINEHELLRSTTLHVSIYEIDPTFYQFVETGEKNLSDKLFCNVSTSVVLSDLDYTDKQKFQQLFPNEFDHNKMLFINESNQNDIDADNFSKLPKLLSSPPEHYLYHRRLDNFDICQIRKFLINSTRQQQLENNQKNENKNLDLIMNHRFRFYLNHIYIFKLELCSFGKYDHCRIYNRYLFVPKWEQLSGILLNETNDHNNILLWIILIFILFALLISVMFLCRSRLRLKSFVNMDVVSVNPDYGLINQNIMIDHHSLWSWPSSMSSNGYNNSHNQSVNGSSGMFGMNYFDNNNITCEIDRQFLIINHQKLLGKGEFGFVYEGLLLDHGHCPQQQQQQQNQHLYPNVNSNQIGDVKQTRVAIKQLKDGANGINKEKFINEAKFMKTFQSNFLVKLIGICTVQEPILVVMEYMERGDLKRYLRQRYQDYLKSRNQELLPSMEELTLMAVQIADGMHYLHSKKVIHRDLAARNCMVSSDLTVKIGDFGLTRDLYERDYYRLSEEMPMPLRWMAPESVRKMIFTPQTDIWSYGVVLWEIMSFGDQPYRGNPDLEVKRLIHNCKRLQRPFYYFEPLWNISQKCWRKKPNQRPSFDEIIESLLPYLTTNRQQFDNLSYYISSRMGSYVKFSPFGLFLNQCYEFISKYKSNFNNDHSNNNNSGIQSSTSSSTSWSTCSTSTASMTKPLVNRNKNFNEPKIQIMPPTTSQTQGKYGCSFRFFDKQSTNAPKQSIMDTSIMNMIQNHQNQSGSLNPNNNFGRQISQQSSISNSSEFTNNTIMTTTTNTTTNNNQIMNLFKIDNQIGVEKATCSLIKQKQPLPSIPSSLSLQKKSPTCIGCDGRIKYSSLESLSSSTGDNNNRSGDKSCHSNDSNIIMDQNQHHHDHHDNVFDNNVADDNENNYEIMSASTTGTRHHPHHHHCPLPSSSLTSTSTTLSFNDNEDNVPMNESRMPLISNPE